MATAFDNTINDANNNANDEIQPVPQEGEIVEAEEYLDTETDTDDEDYVPEEESTGSNEDIAKTTDEETDEETDDDDEDQDKNKKTPVPRREFWTSEKLILCAGLALGIVNIAPHVPDALEWWCRRAIF